MQNLIILLWKLWKHENASKGNSFIIDTKLMMNICWWKSVCNHKTLICWNWIRLTRFSLELRRRESQSFLVIKLLNRLIKLQECNERKGKIGVNFNYINWWLLDQFSCTVELKLFTLQSTFITYPGTPPDSMCMASVTSSDQTSYCHLMRPITPQSTFPEWIPILMSTMTLVASRTDLKQFKWICV